MVLKGIVIKTRYRNADDTWHVVHVKLQDKSGILGEEISATGYIPWTSDDGLIEMEGEWTTGQYGDTFQVSQAWKPLPTTIKGIKRYLEEEVSGIGPSKADALSNHFGTDLLNVISNNPAKLVECKGITLKIANDIFNCWSRDGLQKKVGMFLSDNGISIVWRDKIVSVFGSMAVEKISNNPYVLTSIRGIGFNKADEIAKKLGYKNNSPERVKASCLHVLQKASEEGHCFVELGVLKDQVSKLTKVKDDLIEESITSLVESKELIERTLSNEETKQTVLYIPHIYDWEKCVSLNVVRLVKGKPTNQSCVSTTTGEFSEDQVLGISNALNNKISIITGAPGTGKSSTVKGIVKLANKYGKSISLCAPTGRAAKRLSELTGEEASTIHRLLKYDRESEKFTYSEENTLPCDILIVDESSMLDIELANKLLNAISDNTSVVFVGDIDQLPPVGAGSFLKDLIKSEKVVITNLTKIFRQAQKSLMVQNSHRIKAGEYPVFPPKGSEADSYNLAKSSSDGEDSDWAEKAVTQMVTKNIPEKIKALYNIDIDPKTDIQVLIPMKKGSYGVFEANKSLQKVLNPNGTQFHLGSKSWRVGDKVIQNVNNYELDIYNGDIGIIKSIDNINKTVCINFDGRCVDIPYKIFNEEIALAYGLSIHKSQGSEYKVTVVVLLWQHYPMLDRNLLYTANTRAKLMTLYVTAGGTIQKAVDTNKVISRNSLLAHRIKSDYAKELNNAHQNKDV